VAAATASAVVVLPVPGVPVIRMLGWARRGAALGAARRAPAPAGPPGKVRLAPAALAWTALAADGGGRPARGLGCSLLAAR